jgi:hypothetical protein
MAELSHPQQARRNPAHAEQKQTNKTLERGATEHGAKFHHRISKDHPPKGLF